MNPKITDILALKLGKKAEIILKTIGLFNEGATIPFISRYRKDLTGGMDEVEIALLKNSYDKLLEIEKRKINIIETIKEQNALTDELLHKINNCFDENELEDIYLPYKPKRKTKAVLAKERGLEPFAKIIMKQEAKNIDSLALKYTSNDVPETEDAINGALDIIAEWISENEKSRDNIRRIFERDAFLSASLSKGKETEGEKYRDYFNYNSPLKKCPSHRYLAIIRAENEGVLKVDVAIDETKANETLSRIFLRAENECSELVSKAIKDSYKRLIKPSIENEFRKIYKEKADEEAIKVFTENLRQLLLTAPLGQKRTLAIDPGFKSGCKVVCLDQSGALLHNENIYPHAPQNEAGKAKAKISTLVQQYNIEAIAIGNGTASRETEFFIKGIRFDRDLEVFMVDESGASIYSASSIARQEFPQFDVTVRGSVSIGRRLMDPLAELVKIEPKNLGIGQYQHDVDQKLLEKSLTQVVESCVNYVGVNLNTASSYLLTYVSGIGSGLAKNIIDYRTEKGLFKSREDLKKIPRFGEKAFEQSAGFLRVPDSENPLDNSSVHPERYSLVKKMAKDLKVEVKDLIGNEALINQINPEKYVSESAGIFTLNDIIQELKKPGRDPRKKTKMLEFDKNIRKIDDLHEGMILNGIVTNLTNFGAFVNIGIKENGLVHISQICDEFISNAADKLKLHQHLKVKVLQLDKERGRIQLTLKGID